MMNKELQLAFKYLEAIGIKHVFEKQLTEAFFKIACEAPPSAADELTKLKQALVWDNIAPVLAKTLIKEVPKDILQGVIDFYSTETGQYLRDNLLDITEKLQESLKSFVDEELKKLD